MTTSEQSELNLEKGGKSKRKKLKRKWLIVGFLFFGTFAYWYVADIGPVDDSDLFYPAPLEHSGPNFFHELTRLEITEWLDTYKHTKAQINSDELTIEEAEGFLKSSEGTMRRIEDIIDTEKLVSVRIAFPGEGDNRVGRLNRVASLLKIQSECYILLGHSSLAVECYLRLLKYGYCLSSQRASKFGFLISNRAISSAIALIVKNIQSGALTSEDIAKVQSSLESRQFDSEVFEMVIRSEYNWLITQWSKAVELNSSFLYRSVFKPNKTKRHVLQYCRVLIQDLKRAPKDRIAGQLLHSWRYSSNEWAFYLTDNIVGRDSIRGLLHFSLYDSEYEYESYRYQNAAVQVFLAMHAYSLQFGRLPDMISELSPAFLKSVPLNSVGGPLVYFDKVNFRLLPVAEDPSLFDSNTEELARDERNRGIDRFSLSFSHLKDQASKASKARDSK